MFRKNPIDKRKSDEYNLTQIAIQKDQELKTKQHQISQLKQDSPQTQPRSRSELPPEHSAKVQLTSSKSHNI